MCKAINHATQKLDGTKSIVVEADLKIPVGSFPQLGTRTSILLRDSSVNKVRNKASTIT
jgi:hypothetical protein